MSRRGIIKYFKKHAAGVALAGASFMVVAAPPKPCPQDFDPAKIKSLPGFQKYNLHDLTAHPMAGMVVEIQLIKKDAIGGRGVSEPCLITLPKRDFRNDLARDLIDMRRDLALDSRLAPEIRARFDRFIAANEKNIYDPDLYVSIKSLQKKLTQAKGVDPLDSVVQDFWKIILQLENTANSSAEQELIVAERNLREGLEVMVQMDDLRRLTLTGQRALDNVLFEQIKRFENNSHNRKIFESMLLNSQQIRKLIEDADGIDRLFAERMLVLMQDVLAIIHENSKKIDAEKSNPNSKMEKMKLDLEQMKAIKLLQRDIEDAVREQERLIGITLKEDAQNKIEINKIVKEIENLTHDIEENVKDEIREEKKRQEEIKSPNSSLRPPIMRVQYESPADFGDGGTYVIPDYQVLGYLESRIRDARAILLRDMDGELSLSQSEVTEMLNAIIGIRSETNTIREKYPLRPPSPEFEARQLKINRALDNIETLLSQRLKNSISAPSTPLADQQDELQESLKKLVKRAESLQFGAEVLEDVQQKMLEAFMHMRQGDTAEAIRKQREAASLMKKLLKDSKNPNGATHGEGSSGSSKKDESNPMGRGNPNERIGVDPSKNPPSTRQIEQKIIDRLNDPDLPGRERDYMKRLVPRVR